MQVEIFKCKLDLMQQQEAQKSKVEQPKEKEEQYKAREHLFNEWEWIQLYIRQLSRTMENETNEILKYDIQSDTYFIP